ncbi:hypothetical protein PWT90_02932 [Aphanocladium album]|nr:hypothetical protein PWT90_02932 [Aphanocladium album]
MRPEPKTAAAPKRILFVDAYDSFANNIVGLLETHLGAAVEVILVHIDDHACAADLAAVAARFDAVVVGPGPGNPTCARDVGLIDQLWRLDDANTLPVLGICLGFQSLCLAHGAGIRRLSQPRHGIVSRVSHQRTDILRGLDDFDATQYHSLCVDIGTAIGGDDERMWVPSPTCPDILPLAWDRSDAGNGPILLAARHVDKPFWGVQFHPESVCTSEAGRQLVVNWWAAAQEWSAAHRPRITTDVSSVVASSPVSVDFADSGYAASSSSSTLATPRRSALAKELRSVVGPDEVILRWGKHSSAAVSPVDLLEALGHSSGDDCILLDSQGHASGRYSIIGLVTPGRTMKLTYRVGARAVEYGLDAGRTTSMPVSSIDDVWPLLQECLDLHEPQNKTSPSSRASTPGAAFEHTGMDRYVANHLPADSPFWGGWMGYVSYEAGLETIDVPLNAAQKTGADHDVSFAFVHRCVVVDHETANVYVQSLLPGDWPWIMQTGTTLDNLVSNSEIHALYRSPSEAPVDGKMPTKEHIQRAVLDATLVASEVARPAEEAYRANVLACQTFLRTGDSYELCLTDQTTIITTKSGGLDPWTLYKKLRSRNAAPFGAFVRLSGAVVVGSSPERFLRWSRSGRCQFRPIKGTVKKGPDMTRERAHAILGSSKERAENLMIVDLIRHDLAGVVGAGNTWVAKLMTVEEYETVYQLVSVIEGQLPSASPCYDSDRDSCNEGRVKGIDVLRASLPPGSMTGAPKKRSCEILGALERRPRGIYAGVLGYMDVGGGGDFSVVIRTAVRRGVREEKDRGHEEKQGRIEEAETWHVGAGGAVTIQSTDEGEFREMEVKASSVLGALFL